MPARHRRSETLFIDARKLGHMLDRTRRDLSLEDIARIADTYHAWRGHNHDSPLPLGEGQSLPRTRSGGEGKSRATPTSPASARAQHLQEIRKHGHVLTPGRYVGAEPQLDDGEPFDEEDGPPYRPMAGAAGRSPTPRRGHRGKPDTPGVWRWER